MNRNYNIRMIKNVWDDAGFRLGITLPSVDPIIERYEEPNRVYHGLDHVANALTIAGTLQQGEDPIIDLALIFHDAIYDPSTPSCDERSSADLALQMLYPTGFPYLITEVYNLVVHTMFSRYRTIPTTFHEAVVRDADLAGFVDPEVAAANALKIREEYLNFGITAEQFDAGRPAFLQSMLDLPRIFHTPHAFTHSWHRAARTNIQAELQAAS